MNWATGAGSWSRYVPQHSSPGTEPWASHEVEKLHEEQETENSGQWLLQQEAGGWRKGGQRDNRVLRRCGSLGWVASKQFRNNDNNNDSTIIIL